MTLDVIGFGALNLDKLYTVNTLAERGEERVVSGYLEAAGGSAANAIVGLVRLGHRVGYVGKVGNDREGEFLLHRFKEEEVDTRGITVSTNGRSGVVLGFIDGVGERTLYVDPGVNDTLGKADVDLDYVKSAQFVHFTSFVGTKPFEAQKALLHHLSDVRVSLDPGDLYARKGLSALRPLLAHSHVVFPNEKELQLITGKGYVDGARVLVDVGAHIVAVKLGERGCYITDGRHELLVEAFQVKVVDATGAGDAFCAGFLHGLLLEKDLYACGRLANFVASRKVGKRGAREGLPRLSELEELRL
jgi:ribokinase